MRRKIVLSLLLLFTLFSIGALIASWYVTVATNQLRNLVNMHEVEELRRDLVISLQDVQADVYTMHTFKGRNLDGIITSVEHLDQAAAECSECHHSPAVQVQLDEVQKLLDDYKTAVSHYITASANKRRIDAAEQEAASIGNQILLQTETMSRAASKTLDHVTERAITRVNQVRVILFITVIFTIVLSLGVASSLVKAVTKPIERLVAATSIIESGDLGYRIDDVQETEFQKLSEHFNAMSAALQRSHAQLETNNAELQRQINERKDLQAQLLHAQKMEAMGTLSAGIAHEFGNSIQIIQGGADLLATKNRNQGIEQPELEMISDAAHRAADLSKRLLTFGSKSETELLPIDLNERVHHVATILRQTLPKTINFQTTLQGDIAAVNADSAQIELVLINLALNAKDAMPKGGFLQIETAQIGVEDMPPRESTVTQPRTWVRLSVTDDGEGMDAETVSRIFDPFFTTKGLGVGTGLGLAVVYGIVKEFGGRIYCESEPGSGTTFNIFLPGLPEGSLKSKTEPKPTEGSSLGNETILLVDDEMAMVEVMGVALEEQGYAVQTASSGEKALELFEENSHEIEVVILDIGMPGMGGQACLEKLLELDPEVKVIMSSAYGTQEKQNDLMKLGARGFLVKPYRLADILKAIEAVLTAGLHPPGSKC